MTYSIRDFVRDATSIVASGDELGHVQAEIGERLVTLAKRDDLTSHGAIIGPSDASFNSYLLWRETPHFYLALVQFEPEYRSPIHEHGDHWVVSAGHRGVDRWDVYERIDDRTVPGEAQLALHSQTAVIPGVWTVLPAPPRSIHSHNNLTSNFSSELIFSATKPLLAEERLHFDVEAGTCRPSWFAAGQHTIGESYPPHGLR